MGELRWTLLGLGILAILAIWWWTARRSGQAPGNAELRESTAAPPVHGFAPAGESALAERRPAVSESRNWGVPPLEPLSIRTTDLEGVPELDEPMMIDADPLDMTMDIGPPAIKAPPPVPMPPVYPASAPAAAPTPAASAAPVQRSSAENSDRLATVAPQVPNVSEMQRIVTVRVCAVGAARWSGAALMAALELHGLAYGRYQVYHRKHSDGRSIFCVASLIEPGTFDIAHMAEEEFRGVSLFAVLPGPLDSLQTIDALLATARDLARELSGTVQDAKGMPFSPQRAAALREDVARFQALLP